MTDRRRRVHGGEREGLERIVLLHRLERRRHRSRRFVGRLRVEVWIQGRDPHPQHARVGECLRRNRLAHHVGEHRRCRVAHGARIFPAVLRVERERAIDEIDERRMRLAPDREERGGRLRPRLEHHLLRRFALMYVEAREQREHRRPDGIEVGLWADEARLAPRLLRRHEGRRPHHVTGLRRIREVRLAEPGDAEVEHFGLTGPRDEEIRRLQVTMDHVLRMRGGEHVEHLVHRREHGRRR